MDAPRSNSNRTSADLFAPAGPPRRCSERIGEGAVLLRGFAVPEQSALLNAIERVAAQAPFRHLETPGGFTMSVAMTNCGSVGWVSDRSGYRYDPCDPVTGKSWPVMPQCFLGLASRAAARAGFRRFAADVCLVNRYEPGARLSLHQDKDETDFTKPIVSVSLGVPAVFLFGGFRRSERQERVVLEHGDVVVWGGPDRLRYHGVLPLRENHHPLLGPIRINLTFRRAGA